jgi:multiple sugar transport system permease protein
MRPRSARRSLAGLGKAAALALVAAWSAGPIVLMVLASFRPDREIFDPMQHTITPTLVNYRTLGRNWSEFFAGLANSAIVSAGAAVLAVIASALAGYAYSRLRRRWMAGSAAGLIVLRLIPPIVLTLPLFPIVAALRLSDTHLVLILLYATFFVSLGTVVMRTFMDQVPREMDEAALVDGAGRMQVLTRVIAPLAAPGMVAVAIFVVVFAWNDFLFAFIFTAQRAKTAPLVLAEMTGAIDGVEWGVLFAATTLHLVPVLLMVVLLQRWLVDGLTAGSTKG